MLRVSNNKLALTRRVFPGLVYDLQCVLKDKALNLLQVSTEPSLFPMQKIKTISIFELPIIRIRI